MATELTARDERIDDYVLLLHVFMRMDLAAILDRHLSDHHLRQGLSWGWVATIWLAHILSQGDHRKLTVREWVVQSRTTLEQITGLTIRETDFTDDRLTIVLRALSNEGHWRGIEADLTRLTLRVYELTPERVRLDATTVSGYHAEGIMRFGHSKEDGWLRQVKLMAASLDPLGMPVASRVTSGDRADDGLYVPVIKEVIAALGREGLLFVGDSKMSATATRGYLEAAGQRYLTPLAMVGEAAREMPGWVAETIAGGHCLTRVTRLDERGEEAVVGWGREVERACSASLEDGRLIWTERVLIAYSPEYAAGLRRGLEQRLARAIAKIHALTPPPGRGKRQLRSEAELNAAARAILREHRVEGLIDYACAVEVTERDAYVGRGRGGADRPRKVVTRTRCRVTAVTRREADIRALSDTLGWRAYATNAPVAELPFDRAVLTYRDEWLIERSFHRLKGAPLSIAPLFVKRDDQIVGLTHLLTLAVRFLTLIEFQVRRELARTGEELPGLFPENPKKTTATPTAERLLRAFANITLIFVHLPDRTVRYLKPLNQVQTRILELLGFSTDIYSSLAIIQESS